MRRLIVVAGLVLLVVGVVFAVYPLSEESPIDTTLRDWGITVPIWPSTLNGTDKPGNRTVWGVGGMGDNSRFEFNLSLSGPVRVTVSALTNPESPTGGTMTPVFDQVKSVFRDKVNVGYGTWQVDIVNEGLTPVDILPGSFVVAKETSYETRVSYPFSLVGTFIALLGVVMLAVGVTSKPKVRRKKA